MVGAVVVVFIVAYAAIALEHPLKINKSASALVGAGVLWTIYFALGGDNTLIGNQLDESVTSTAKIAFFLIGAMTIVEVIDAHNGFEVITSLISTRRQVTLMWIVCFVTFFLSAAHLPPFMGILFALGILWLVGELVHRDKEAEEKRQLMPPHALTRIDMSSIVFFIGILLAVATLEHTAYMRQLNRKLERGLDAGSAQPRR